MRAKFLIALCAAIAILVAIRAFAHHSFAAEFDFNKSITLAGVLTKMVWENPHGWIFLDVKDENGKVQNWAVETGSPLGLLRKGLRKEDFPVGVEIIVEGFRGRGERLTANGTSVKFKDGRNFFLG